MVKEIMDRIVGALGNGVPQKNDPDSAQPPT